MAMAEMCDLIGFPRTRGDRPLPERREPEVIMVPPHTRG